MSPANSILKVFISSTSEDLEDYRVVASKAIIETGWFPVFSENFGAMPENTVEACYSKLKDCDLVILLIAFRQGWIPTKEQGGNEKDSITALEYQYAQNPEHKKDVLIFLADEKKPWPPIKCDKGPAGDWITEFRSKLGKPADFFEYEEPAGKEANNLPLFRAKIYGALVSYKEELLKKIKDPDTPPPSGPTGLENFPGASRRLLSGRCIPFLGHGVFGKGGPLSICALRKEMGDESCRSCDESIESCPKSCLATAAEYQELVLGRDQFLDRLREIIEAQAQKVFEEKSRNAATLAVYDLLEKIKPPLIVSATEDLLLEEQLSAAGKRCLILSHVIRSVDRDYCSKVLVFKGVDDKEPKPRFADEIDELIEEEKLPDEEKAYIIYKPLGSPLLHRYVNQKLGIDTVVMTEADYLILLQRLENEKTGVPKTFFTFFNQYPPIFLGYPMDVWHYRLVGQVFQSIGLTRSSLKPFFSVRKADSSMEQKAWEKLGINLVPMDPNVFSQKVEIKT
jgi:hypothetical protein